MVTLVNGTIRYWLHFLRERACPSPDTPRKVRTMRTLAAARSGGAAVWLVAAVGYLALEAVTAAAFGPDYSYARNLISDLGVPDISPRAPQMNAGFYLQGLGFLGGAILISRASAGGAARLFVGLAAANALGNLLVGTVHSGEGVLHVVGAALAIGAGNAAILAGAAVLRPTVARRWYAPTSTLIAAAGLISASVWLLGSSTAAGAWERGSVYSILLWQALTAVYLMTARPRAPR